MHKSNITLLIILLLGLLSMAAVPALSYESATPSPSFSPPPIVDSSSSGKLHFSKAEQDWLAQNHVVRVQVGDYAPLQLFKEKPTGISVDYLNAIAKKTGLQVEYQKETSWAETLNLVRSRKGADLLLGAMSTKERREYLIFTEVYLSFPSVIFTPKDRGFIGSLQDLSGKVVSVQKKVVVHELLVKKYPDLKLLPKNTEKDALYALVTGESDAYVGNLTVGSFYIQSNGWNNIKVAAPTGFDPQNLSMAVRSDWPELVSIINKTMETFTPDEHTALRSRWSAPIRYEYGISGLDVVKWVIGISSFLIVIIAIISWWNKKLSREIAIRTVVEAKLETKNKDMEQVLHVTSHDLRSPLVSIQGFSDILEISLDEMVSLFDEDKLSSEIKEKLSSVIQNNRESINYINQGVLKMDLLLKGLSQVSRAGQVKIKKEELDMNELLSNISGSFMLQCEEQGAKIEMSELTPCLGDDGQIDQLFTNLIANALKYSDPDRPCIIKISGQKEGTHSVYCVEDNGIGIAPEFQEKIFGIFHQLNPGANGEGLGLSIVQKITERHDGRIWVESELGKSSRFYVSLPHA